MATLEHFQNAGNQRWGQGWEQFNFWYTAQSAKQWREKNFPPQILTSKFLLKTQAPVEAVALVRDIARLNLLDGQKIEDNGEYTRKLAEMGLELPLGEIYEEKSDSGRTTNYVIPIKSRSTDGNVEVVVNSAWGVQWRLSKDHPLVQEEGKLAKTQNEDTSITPTEERKYGMETFLDPHQLEIVSEANGINSKKLAIDLSVFISDVLSYPGASIESGGMTFGSAQDDNTSCLNIKIGGISGLIISFNIGDKFGTKSVSMLGPHNKGNEQYDKLANKAREFENIIDSFYKFTE